MIVIIIKYKNINTKKGNIDQIKEYHLLTIYYDSYCIIFQIQSLDFNGILGHN